MTLRPEIIMLIVACMVVTVIPRVMPMVLVNRIELPEWFLAWLHHIPVAVISALFFREVLLLDGDWRDWHDPYFLAAWPTLAVALWSRNIFITVIVGVLIFVVLRWLL